MFPLRLVLFLHLQCSLWVYADPNVRISNNVLYVPSGYEQGSFETKPDTRSRRKRGVFTQFTDQETQIILEQHNRHRADEGATNMLEMKWDSYLADMAQEWSDECVFDHGQPVRENPPFSKLGQNLYMTTAAELNIRGPTMAWFGEKSQYKYENNTCDGVCGHYTQVVWASSHALGCGWASCPIGIIVTCNYGPPGNYVGVRPYLAGPVSCSHCHTGVGWCRGGFCDVCNAICKNCGSRDPQTCTCSCEPGWRGSDCSEVCEDGSDLCGGNPGWPRSWCTSQYPYVLKRCPAFCGLCDPGPSAACEDPDGEEQSPGGSTDDCGEWDPWDVSGCRACGGCGQKTRLRKCGIRVENEVADCDPKPCVRGVNSLRETFYKVRPKDGRRRKLDRKRRCCYDYKPAVPVRFPRPKICHALGGWIDPEPS